MWTFNLISAEGIKATVHVDCVEKAHGLFVARGIVKTLHPDGAAWQFVDPEQQELQAAFDLVKDRDDWKNRVYAIVTNVQLVELAGDEETGITLIEEAIVYFTGSMPTLSPNGREWRICAAGYHTAIGM